MSNRLTHQFAYILCLALLFLRWECKAQADVESIVYGGVDFKVYQVDLASADLHFYWKGSDGQPFRSFAQLENELNKRGKDMVFATNAGIYHPSLTPVGLYVENSIQKNGINLKDGAGNFYLKPNAVFYITKDRKAGVIETSRYTSEVFTQKEVQYATQSGPQLIIDGQIHPKFNEGSTNAKIRSGVGIIHEGKVVFVISVQPVNLYTFAKLFIDKFKCKNALYLDGAISSMEWQHNGKYHQSHVPSHPFSVIIAHTIPLDPKKKTSTRPEPQTKPDEISLTMKKGSFRGSSSGIRIAQFAPKDFNAHITSIKGDQPSEHFWTLKDDFSNHKAMFAIEAFSAEDQKSIIGIDFNDQLVFSDKFNFNKEAIAKLKVHITAGPQILRGGQRTSYFSRDITEPFSAICNTATGDLLLIGTDDKLPKAGTLSLEEFANLLKRLSVQDAYILSSGRATHSHLAAPYTNYDDKIDPRDNPYILIITEK